MSTGVIQMHTWIRRATGFVLILSVCSSGQFAADLNGNKHAGFEDLVIIADYWLEHDNIGCNGDTGSDCRIDMADIAKLAEQWQWMECISTASASGVENASYSASNAIDGNLNTRWSSAFEDNQWLQIDCGQRRNIYGLTIYWENAYARVYNVQVSTDTDDWATLHSESNGNGRMEARIKLPEGGQGIWPAFWMLGNNISSIGWPACGEIDILEAVNDFTEVHGTLHYGSDPSQHDMNGGSYTPPVDVSDDYHIYAVEWEPTMIRWYFDDVNYYSTTNWWTGDPYPAPFNQPFFFILNIAVGGNWPGYPDASTPFPQSMYVDYVRVYQAAP